MKGKWGIKCSVTVTKKEIMLVSQRHKQQFICANKFIYHLYRCKSSLVWLSKQVVHVFQSFLKENSHFSSHEPILIQLVSLQKKNLHFCKVNFIYPGDHDTSHLPDK